MDLGNVRQNLANGAYNDPTEFTKDMRLMFSNSKSFNTNKRSRIYAMTLRLSAMFAERIKDVLTSWKRAMKQNRKRYKNGYACCVIACTMAGKSVWSKFINTHVGHVVFVLWPYVIKVLKVLTHISLSSFLWDIGKQCKQRSDCAECSF